MGNTNIDHHERGPIHCTLPTVLVCPVTKKEPDLEGLERAYIQIPVIG